MILTLAEYKVLPPYRSTQSDAMITALLPLIESDFLAIRGIDWRRVTGDIASASAEISSLSSLVGIEVGQFVEGSDVRGQIIAIDRDAKAITLDTAASADTADVALTVYPAGARMTAARMLAFQVNEGERDTALASESIEKHATQADSERIGGYPRSIVGGIRRHGGIG